MKVVNSKQDVCTCFNIYYVLLFQNLHICWSALALCVPLCVFPVIKNMSVGSSALLSVEQWLNCYWYHTTYLNVRNLTHFFLVGPRKIRVFSGTQMFLTHKHLNYYLDILRVYETFAEFREVLESERIKVQLQTSRC